MGKEASENACVWKVYLDEAKAFDDEMLKGFRDTLDALLVFVSILGMFWISRTMLTNRTDSPFFCCGDNFCGFHCC